MFDTAEAAKREACAVTGWLRGSHCLDAEAAVEPEGDTGERRAPNLP